MQSIDREIALNNIQTASELLSQSLTGSRVAATLLSVFGLLALVLAGVGIYGVMSYSVNLRSQEIGIRIALGAQREDVLKMVLRQGMTLVGIGLAVGLLMAAGVSRLMSGLLYGVGTADVRAFAVTGHFAKLATLPRVIFARQKKRASGRPVLPKPPAAALSMPCRASPRPARPSQAPPRLA